MTIFLYPFYASEPPKMGYKGLTLCFVGGMPAARCARGALQPGGGARCARSAEGHRGHQSGALPALLEAKSGSGSQYRTAPRGVTIWVARSGARSWRPL